MKKTILLLLAVIATATLQSQTKYEEGMKKAFELWQNDKQWEAANIFERIANVEPDNWLPPFYVAQINVLYSFDEKDEEKLTAQLKKAQDFLNDAKAISKNNPEIMVVQAQIYTAWIVYDGQLYGMKYSPIIAEIYKKAAAIDPDNPRVAMGKVEWDMGTARFFGQSTDTFCEDLQKAYQLFATFEPEGEFYPDGGADYAKSVVERTCNQ